MSKELAKLEKVIVACGAKEAKCVCAEPIGHEGPHECSEKLQCNGSWHYEGETFIMDRIPGLSALFEFLLDDDDDLETP